MRPNAAAGLPLTLLALLAITACSPTQDSDFKESGVRLDYLDRSVKPGDDFFRFANGQWLDSTEIPADKARYGAFVILNDKAREDVRAIVQSAGKNPEAEDKGTEAQQIADFYQSYMDATHVEERGLAPLQSLLDEIAEISSYSDLAEYFAIANRRGVTTPLSFYIYTDEKDPDSYITYVNQSGLGLPDREYYLRDDEQSQTLQQAYRDHIGHMLGLLGESDTAAHAEQIYTLEAALAELHWPRRELRDREKTYNKRSRQQLLETAEHFDWNRYWDAAELDRAEHFIISVPDYIASFDDQLTAFDLATWRHYLRWHTLTAYAELLPEAVSEADFAFYGTQLSGTTEREERWKRAINLLNGQVGEAIGKLYVRAHFSPEAKARMEQLVENLRSAYSEAIEELDWMSPATKEKAQQKLAKFTPKIGYPDQWRDLSDLEVAADDLFGNYLRAREFHYQYEIDRLGSPVDREEWFMTPQTVNAYYNPGMNEIVFPAAILQPPFFNMAADDAINYGAIGAVIGHEMGHGFDDQGAKSDGDGRLVNWWTEQDLEEFERRTQQLVAQYNSYTVLDGVQLDGELTQGENIGDLSGLTIAYRAYQLALGDTAAPILDGFTGAQRFFLGWGQVWANKYRDQELRRRIVTDPHSPPRFRTNGVVRNMPEFYQAFSVEPDHELYLSPEQRVKIW